MERSLMHAESQEVVSPQICPSQKAADPFVVVVYPSCTMKNALASAINLTTLLIGIAIGIMLAPHIEKPAQAGIAQSQTAAPAPATSVPPQAVEPSNSNVEQISPVMTAGSEGIYLILAHHTQTDELVVNGLDMLKLQQGELNLLARIPGVYPWDIQNIVTDARNTHLYQVAAPKPPAPVNPPAK
jgi:hypothetical protein